MSKIKKIEVSNLKAVAKLSADFNGCTAIVTGGNNKGKSSFLRCLVDRIRDGKQANVLKRDEKNGHVFMELTTGEKFSWQFGDKVPKGEKLTFTTRDELTISVTQEVQNKFFPKSFDIDSFLLATPLEKRKTLERICKIDISDLQLQHDKAFEDRKFAKKALDEAEKKLSGVSFDDSLPLEPTPTEAMLEAMQQIEDMNAKINRNKAILEQKNQVRLDKYNSWLLMQEEINLLDVEIGKLTAALNSPKNQIVDTAEMRQEYALVVEQNSRIAENIKGRILKDEVEAQSKNVSKFDAEVKTAREQIDQKIKSSNLPDGFAFSETGITYNSYPLERESQSSSALYIAALKLASLTLGQVKTMHFDASFLDRNSLQQIEDWATENDFQLLIERPDFDGGEITYEIIES